MNYEVENFLFPNPQQMFSWCVEIDFVRRIGDHDVVEFYCTLFDQTFSFSPRGGSLETQ